MAGEGPRAWDPLGRLEGVTQIDGRDGIEYDITYDETTGNHHDDGLLPDDRRRTGQQLRAG